ncbi:MAG: IMP cyclohydrolase [Victivallaceae bacterium]|nr:IMP cyclohydrolase [Victivallaceae bacterium]
MYLGRIVAVGRTLSGRNAALYRVSSRSFPNRQAVENNGRIAVVPRPGAEGDLAKNPYISYNCLRIAGKVWAVATNGSQTDPIAEKIDSGMNVRDAISLGLLALDYEHDSLDTPRIVAVAHLTEPTGFLGIIRKDALLVREFQLKPGVLQYLSTYECNRPCDEQRDEKFDAVCCDCAAQYAVDGGVFAGFDHPVTSAAALASDGGFSLGLKIV